MCILILHLQDGHASDEDYIKKYWDTDDELEIENIAPSYCSSLITRNTNGEVIFQCNY